MRPTIAIAVVVALAACASPAVAREAGARSGPYALELVGESGRRLPTFDHRGRTWVLGRAGERYLLRVRNDSDRRVEVVASVDGRDVLDGRPASLARRGYLVGPGETLTIDGFRLSTEAVAAFRFSSVAGSYAARMGDDRDVGVGGAALFPERRPPAPAPLLGLRRGEGRDDLRGEPEKASPGAPSAPEAAGRALSAERPGLGTAFGEAHGSRVERVAFERESERPEAVLALRYDDRAGLAAMGIDVDGRQARLEERRLREGARPFPGGFAEPPPGWTR
jgi:hypothetical protein